MVSGINYIRTKDSIMTNKLLPFLYLVLTFLTGGYTIAQSDKVISLVKGKKEINSLCFSNGGTQLIFNEGNKIYYENVTDQSQIAIFNGGHNKKILSVDLSSDSSKIVTGGQDSIIILWDHYGKIIKKLNFHRGIVTAVKFDPKGNYIYSGSTDRRIVCYSIPGDSIVYDFEVFKDDILSIDISRDGKLLALGGAKGEAKVLDSRNGQIIMNIKSPDWVRCVRFNNNSSLLAICCDNGAIYLWKTSNPQDIRIGIKHKLTNDWITSMDFFPDNESFSYASENGIIGISILGNVSKYRLKVPVLMIRNRPGLSYLIDVAVATFGQGIKLIKG